MPLSTQIIRDGEPLELRWSLWHAACMHEAAKREGKDINQLGTVVLEENHTFVDESDGEVLNLKKGDILKMWHSRF